MTSAMRVGAITIGHSPRPDILEELQTLAVEKVEFVEAGALDGLSIRQIRALAPGGHEHSLVTRLSDGRSVTVSQERIEPLVVQCLRRLETAGVEIILLLCTARFEVLHSPHPLCSPYEILRMMADGMLREGTLAVVVPHASQLTTVPERWYAPGRKLVPVVLSPYDESPSGLREVAAELRKNESQLILLDCIGYRHHVCTQLARLCGVPVLCPRVALATVLRAFVTFCVRSAD